MEESTESRYNDKKAKAVTDIGVGIIRAYTIANDHIRQEISVVSRAGTNSVVESSPNNNRWLKSSSHCNNQMCWMLGILLQLHLSNSYEKDINWAS